MQPINLNRLPAPLPPEYITISPIPKTAGKPLKTHARFGTPNTVYEYRSTSNEIIGYVYRFDDRNGKQVLPLTYVHNTVKNTDHWIYRAWDNHPPIYGAEHLLKFPESSVLIVEGEKCKDAAAVALKPLRARLIPVCWQGGGQKSQLVDWSVLRGRKIILWPDMDSSTSRQTDKLFPILEQPGFKSVMSIYEKIRDIADTIKFILPPPDLESGWDVADFLSTGDMSSLVEFIKTHCLSYEDLIAKTRLHPFSLIKSELAELDLEVQPLKPVELPTPTPPAVVDYSQLDRPAATIGENLYKVTDCINADVFVAMHRHKVRFDATSAMWFIWNSTNWDCDIIENVYNMAREISQEYYNVSATFSYGSEQNKYLFEKAKKIQALQSIRNMLTIASHAPGIAKTRTDFDQNGMILSVQNGTIDLRTQQLRNHDPKDMMTICIPIRYVPGAECPKWDAFLARIFDAESEMIEFIQRAVGYSLTGSVSEQCFFFAYGTGANGKSIFFETMKMLFSNYWQKAPSDMLMAHNGKHNAGPSPAVARLVGTRFVVASELNKSNVIDEAMIKDLTGSDTITARYLNQNFFDFNPTHKLWVYGNHQPQIRGTDPGIWRRILKIPFSVKIPKEERRKPEDIHAEFREEISGILNWALAGLASYQKIGLKPPQIVTAATSEYRENQDTIGQFIEEVCNEGEKETDTVKDLYEEYKKWTVENKEYTMRKKHFVIELIERGLQKKKGYSKVDMIVGICRKNAGEDWGNNQ
jgi:putative DNA primase/helicase